MNVEFKALNMKIGKRKGLDLSQVGCDSRLSPPHLSAAFTNGFRGTLPQSVKAILGLDALIC